MRKSPRTAEVTVQVSPLGRRDPYKRRSNPVAPLRLKEAGRNLSHPNIPVLLGFALKLLVEKPAEGKKECDKTCIAGGS